MKRWLWVLVGLCGMARANPSPSPVPAPAPLSWGAVLKPATGPAEAIGGYSAGCLLGAARLPFSGPGFRVSKPERARVWGHPSLVAFLRQLGAQVRAKKLPEVVIGDLGQPRGGPAPSGHASHQTGLDVDVAYAGPETSMVDDQKQKPARAFSAKVVRLLQLAAADARVDRIFVNPVLKRGLCRAKGDHAWLHKLRPWWKHHDHFHVRLACPESNRECTPQPALPAGDGCAEIDWWFSPAAQADRKKAHEAYSSKVGAAPPLPPRCGQVLDAR